MIEAITAFDFSLLGAIGNLFSADFWRTPMQWVTTLGDAGFIWIAIAILLLFFPKTRKAGITMGLALVLCLLLTNQTLKPLFARPRPFIQDPSIVLMIPEPGEYSFPSGHSASSFSAAFALWFASRGTQDKKRKELIWFCFGLATCIAFSRLYFMVHFPTDVVAGALVGAVCGGLAAKITDKIMKRGS